MANELSVTISASLNNGNLRESWQKGGVQITQTTKGTHHPVVVVGTSEEVISFGDVSTLGRVFLKNLDAANSVEVGPESGGAMVPFHIIKAGEEEAFRLKPGVVMRAKAISSPVRLEMLLLED